MTTKAPERAQVHQAVLPSRKPASVEVELWRADALEVRRGLRSALDERWSYGRSKANARGFWQALEPHPGKVFVSVVGRRPETVFVALQAVLEPWGITRYCPDGWGAYERQGEAEQHTVGKANTQQIESKHSNWRTRIKRLVGRTIGFSKTERLHDLVLGLFLKRYACGVAV